jgi:hypothetical protein
MLVLASCRLLVFGIAGGVIGAIFGLPLGWALGEWTFDRYWYR